MTTAKKESINIDPSNYLVDRNVVCKMIGIGLSKFYDLRNTDETFPKGIYINSRIVRYNLGEVQEWIANLPNHRPAI